MSRFLLGRPFGDILTKISLKLLIISHDPISTQDFSSLPPRKYHFLIHDHARKLTRIRQTLREGRELSVLLHQDLRDLLTHSDIGRDWGQGFQEQLAEGSRLAEHLVRKLSPGKAARSPDCAEPLQGPWLTRASASPLITLSPAVLVSTSHLEP